MATESGSSSTRPLGPLSDSEGAMHVARTWIVLRFALQLPLPDEGVTPPLMCLHASPSAISAMRRRVGPCSRVSDLMSRWPASGVELALRGP